MLTVAVIWFAVTDRLLTVMAVSCTAVCGSFPVKNWTLLTAARLLPVIVMFLDPPWGPLSGVTLVTIGPVCADPMVAVKVTLTPLAVAVNDCDAAEPREANACAFPFASVVANAGWTNPSPDATEKEIPNPATALPSTSATTSSGIGSGWNSGPLCASPFVLVSVSVPLPPTAPPIVNVLTPCVGGWNPAGEPFWRNNTKWWSPVAAEDGIVTNAVIWVGVIVTLS